jgi:leucyl aminopeptidase
MTTFALADEKSTFDCLIVPLLEGEKFEKEVTALDKKYNGALSQAFDLKDFEAKPMQSTFLYTDKKDAARIFLVGLGKKNSLTARSWKQSVGAAIIASQGKKCKKIGMVVPTAVRKEFGTKQTAKLTSVAVTVAGYAFDNHKSDKDARVTELKSVQFIGIDSKERRAWETGIVMGEKISEAINNTRHLSNTPPTVMTPAFLAKAAEKVGKTFSKVNVKVLSKEDAKKLGMGCFLGVAQGSDLPPKFIIMEYMAGKKSEKPTVLVGKGITFDSGGLSIKPANYMTDMKFDMLGAATVLGTIQAVAALGIKKNIVGLMPACENMPSGTSYRPDDILTNMEGKTVEIDNTDAEGRLVLCDALSYAKKYKPKEVIDFATLTGACMVAIGNERSGLFSNEEKMVEKLQASSNEVGEQLWRLPLGQEFSEAIKSEFADVINTGHVGGRGYGGASAAAAFLEFFTKDFNTGEPAYPWAHIDLSCAYYGGKGKSWIRGGALGFGIETMVEYFS